MPASKKRPKRRIPLPKKTEKVHRDRTKYRRRKKHRKGEEDRESIGDKV